MDLKEKKGEALLSSKNSKDESDEKTNNNSNKHLLQVLEALKQASHDLQQQKSHHSNYHNSPPIKALLQLHTNSHSLLSTDPHLSPLSLHLTRLNSLVDTLHQHSDPQTQNHHHLPLPSFLTRRLITHSISRLASSIESDIQSWIDRQSVDSLSRTLRDPFHDPDELLTLLAHFSQRLLSSRGFNRELQDLLLKFKIFPLLENLLFDPKRSRRVREHAAEAVAASIRFNKDVFVGQVSMGPAIRALVGLESLNSIKVLCWLIRLIRSPFVDEIESNGEIPKIIALLDSTNSTHEEDLEMRVLGMDCVLEIGYFGRKEAVDAMLKEGVVKKLVELQRSEVGGELIEEFDREKRLLLERESERERHPFASCVARFAVQLEIGEGLRQREKRAYKREILLRVREACVSDAECATIVAEVLWGCSP